MVHKKLRFLVILGRGLSGNWNMSWFKEFTVLHVCITITFIVTGLLINLFQLLLLLVLPHKVFNQIF